MTDDAVFVVLMIVTADDGQVIEATAHTHPDAAIAWYEKWKARRRDQYVSGFKITIMDTELLGG